MISEEQSNIVNANNNNSYSNIEERKESDRESITEESDDESISE